ncbi:hypothetical protein BpHYR1_005679 [Brachionus plicatilis]|uniref:Uncharacterized protein n=1 Tax=Brachionus plicatilis TaxID=10195 RepID=A0A3M7QT79_BRAPC|nr:hypothetical protein BpHYR1_005679 [Brachionus plicatilis]
MKQISDFEEFKLFLQEHSRIDHIILKFDNDHDHDQIWFKLFTKPENMNCSPNVRSNFLINH